MGWLVWVGWYLVWVWIVLKLVYWIQVKEYRWDRWWSWIRYNTGWRDVLRLDIRKPEWTIRAGLVTGAGAAAAVFWGLGGALAGTIVGVAGTGLLVSWQRAREMERAKARVEQIKPKVVVVNGSYGKSSTKEFLAQMLASKYKLIKTEENENSELGVARTILNKLKPGVQLMVLEMGAYKRGEVANMCRMARPDVVIITGMGPQHIDLFGSMEDSRRAEFESVEALKPGGTAVFNADSGEAAPMVEWAKKKGIRTETYSVRGQVSKVSPEGFLLRDVWVPVRGAHFAQNIRGTMVVAGILGMRTIEIDGAMGQLKQPYKSLAVRETRGIEVIDNSYNTNPEGFAASLDYLKLFKRKKIVFTPGIIELGQQTKEVHRQLGKLMAGWVDEVWLSRANVAKFLADGGVRVVRIDTPEKVDSKLKELKKGDTVLIEGRVAPPLMRALRS